MARRGLSRALGVGYTLLVSHALGPGSLSCALTLRLHAERRTPTDLEARRVPLTLAFVPAAHAPELLARAPELLHPAELERLARFRFTRRRHSYVLGRAAAKSALAAFDPKRSPTSVHVAAGVFGQPLVLGVASPPTLSLTHSTRAAAALSIEPGHLAGIDLEDLTLVEPETFERVLSARDEAVLAALAGALPHGAGVVWALKEALSKALCCGFTAPPAVLELSRLEPHPDGGFGALFENFPQYGGRAWPLPDGVLSIVLPKHTRLELSQEQRGQIGALWATHRIVHGSTP